MKNLPIPAAFAIVAFVLTVLAPNSPRLAYADACGRGWVFFDLGNTLIDTSDWKHLQYLPGARDYLRKLRAAGFHLGLISNVPDSWGADVTAKLAHAKKEIAAGWTETEPFKWSDFESILLPPSDPLRKPDPYLFAQARQQTRPCRIAYEGEHPIETQAAARAGFDRVYVVGDKKSAEFFLPLEKIFQSP